MTIYDNMKMFDLAVECGAAINILNKQQLNPLTTAAYLAKKDMFFHIANLEREVYWQIGNVCCSAYPIEQLDSINSSTGELQTQSALNLIVFGVSRITVFKVRHFLVEIKLYEFKKLSFNIVTKVI